MLTPEHHLKYKSKHGKFPDQIPPKRVIFCFVQQFLDQVLEQNRHEAYQGTFRKLFHLLDYPGTAIGNFGVGAPLNAMKMEQMIVWGVKEFYVIGLAGGIGQGLQFGDIIFCDEAIRDEGVSRHYLETGDRVLAPGPLLDLWEKKMQMPHKRGLIWTFDAIYRETRENFLHYQKLGVLGVEMETAALYAVAHFRKVPCASALVISDTHTLEGWVPGFYDPKVLEGQHRLLESIFNLENV